MFTPTLGKGIGPTRPWAPLNTDPIEFVFKVCMHLASNITMTILLACIDFYFIKSNLTIWVYKGPYSTMVENAGR